MAPAFDSAAAAAPSAQELHCDAPNASERTSCRHCALPLGPGSTRNGFCCRGCAAVHRLLHASGLARYYDLRGARPGLPATGVDPEDGAVATGPRDRKWLEPLVERLTAAGPEAPVRLELDVQGLHCAACVWLLETLFRRRPGGIRLLINPAMGRAELVVRGAFDLPGWVAEVERFGYLLGPPTKEPPRRSDDLLVRVGICVALAGNTMLYAAAVYLGLREGPLFEVLHDLQLAMATVAVFVGGSVFFRGAVEGLRRRILHLDVPIALGIALAYAGSVWSFFFADARASYFDSVSVFIALMLVGRWLQERVLERNRNQLLASDGADSLLTRRIAPNGTLSLVRCPEVRAGDRLLLAPGDLVPVDATLRGDEGRFSLEWIDGESTPRRVPAEELVPAGAFHVGNGAVEVESTTDFQDSPLLSLLRTPPDVDAARGRGRWWQRVSGAYVVGVLAAAGLGLTGWLVLAGDPIRAVEVTIAVLVVTCPCAFGIATPLAYELAQGGLRRRGLFVRTMGFLDRALGVRRVVFDKTGTLTTGGLAVADPDALRSLGDDARQALIDLAARSNHPKSLAVLRALGGSAEGGAAVRRALEVEEHPGRGVEGVLPDGRRARLGSAAWAGELGVAPPPRSGPATSHDADLVFALEGAEAVPIPTVERLRPDAAAELAALDAEGLEPTILSGDRTPRALALARTLGLPADRVFGDHRPEDKAAWVRAHDRGDLLFVGDGLNDGPAAAAATCSGTPAVDRPFMPARSDFYFVTPGLAPIRLGLRVSRALAQTVRRNLTFALTYNAVAVALAWAGWMAPWVAALLMPLSSLVVLAATSKALGPRSALWKS
ncbi:MAG TPA: heavy metal translocating P-type ATPase metal-binding domain-containing protein [Polyangiaceae bacterium LLY-WYZ-14_1]|nr:heavy metal translocating P-type ATPase metal-binding domain-containing protein [Polyangiaceae bacterium LLY-WYZ-14_1]